MEISTSVQNTLSASLMTCLGQEDMMDIHLLSSDSVRVPTFCTVLDYRSAILRGILCCNFKESVSGVITLGYNCGTLASVVEFCITDNVRQFKGRGDKAAARGMVQFLAHTYFLDLLFLQDKIRALVGSLLEEKKSLACAVFDEVLLFGKSIESFKLNALNLI